MLCSALIANVGLISLQAQSDQDGQKGRRDRDRQVSNEARLKKYDKNGNGKIDPEEQAAVRTDRRNQNQTRMKQWQEKNWDKIKSYDKNADGKINRDEMRPLFQDVRAGKIEGVEVPQGFGRRAAGRSGRGGDRPQFDREAMKKYDKDGNGELSREERAAARAEFSGSRDSQRKQRQRGGSKIDLQQFDKDGDGKLDRAERQAMREELKKQRQAKSDKNAT